jgi:hypothetical protein
MALAIKVTIAGAREAGERFDRFPTEAHERIVARIHGLTDKLYERVLATAPFKTGKLKSEIVKREFSDNPERIAGYVSVYAPGDPKEYAKAATLEYGTDKPRKVPSSTGIMMRLTGSHRRVLARLSKPVHIEAMRFMRGPLDDMRAEVNDELSAALNEAANAKS